MTLARRLRIEVLEGRCVLSVTEAVLPPVTHEARLCDAQDHKVGEAEAVATPAVIDAATPPDGPVLVLDVLFTAADGSGWSLEQG